MEEGGGMGREEGGGKGREEGGGKITPSQEKEEVI
jgi:hypothetical protein